MIRRIIALIAADWRQTAAVLLGLPAIITIALIVAAVLETRA
jgi:hypothetical protein